MEKKKHIRRQVMGILLYDHLVSPLAQFNKYALTQTTDNTIGYFSIRICFIVKSIDNIGEKKLCYGAARVVETFQT